MRLALIAALVAAPALAQPVAGLPPEALGRADEGVVPDRPPGPTGAPLRTLEFDAPLALAAASVGRLDVLADGEVLRCTAVAVTPDLLLTAPDCVPEDAERAALLTGHDGIGPPALHPVEPVPVERGDGYVLLGLEPGTIPPLPLSDGLPDPAAPLALMGFPDGGELRVMLAGCRAGHVPVALGRLTHTCAPAPGLAGGPVIDPATGSVVGIHLRGAMPDGLAFAMPASKILSVSEALGGEETVAPEDGAILDGLCRALAAEPAACGAWDAIAFCPRAPTCEGPEAARVEPALPFVLSEATDLTGPDLGGAAYDGTTLSECEAACRDEPACAAFTHRAGRCRLKAARGEAVAAPGTISGWPATVP